MTALAWCGLLRGVEDTRKQIKLDDVKGSCERFIRYCSKIESFCKSISFIELLLSFIIFLWSSLRCNPVLLKLIIGSKTIREQQKQLQPVFDTAKYLRGSSKLSLFQHGPSLIFTILCWINIIILTIDVLYSIYLWIKIRKEVLYLHFESKDIASVEIRNIYISLAVVPMSAFCMSRYSYFNKYIASSKLNDALEEVHLMTKQMENVEITHTEEEVDEKEQQLEIEKEALLTLDQCLSKSKPFDMKDMEDVLELIVPSFILWNLNIYLLYAGFKYLYFYIVLFIITLLIIIWFKFSKNIGLITPLLLPMTCLIMEFFAFICMATLSLILHQNSPIAALFIAPLIILSVGSLVWKKRGTLHTD